MKTNKFLYKALFVLGLLCCQHTAWGQVFGNVYAPRAEIDASLIDGSDWQRDGWNANTYDNAYDGRSNTYARADDYASRATPTLVFDLGSSHDPLTSLRFIAGTSQQCPTALTIESSNSSNFSQIVTSVSFTGLDRTNGTQDFDLTTPITERYVRLVFTQNNHQNAFINIYEVYLYREGDEPYSSYSIQHKVAKWFDLRKDLNLDPSSTGSFDWNIDRFDASQSLATEGLQAAHTYIDTIYVHKGSSVQLTLPTSNNSNGTGTSSSQMYQRWYSYRTDGTFETNHANGVYDLLTPNNSASVYRFSNGYVGSPLGDIAQSMTFYYPTNAEFSEWFPNSEVDNDWFMVACDVSGYTDFTRDFESLGNNGNYQNGVTRDDILAYGRERFIANGYYEPTIALRVVYYIVGVDDRDMPEGSAKKTNWDSWYGKLTTSAYQGGTIAEGKKYLEEYDITFPNQHLSNYTCEVLSLSKDARSYAIPNVDEGDDTSLDVEIISNGAGIRLVSNRIVSENDQNVIKYTSYGNTRTLTGIARTIQFAKTGGTLGQPWTVDNNSTATIIVTKTVNGTTYNIARFNLTFSAESVPYTQTQVSQIAVGSDNERRSPEWLSRNRRLLTQLNFDYDPAVAGMYGQDDYFEFPLAWDNSSYAFYDGSPWQDFMSSAFYSESVNGRTRNHRWYPEFGYYAITNDYIGYGDQMGNDVRPPMGQDGNLLAKGESNYHIYVDASDRPGILARLPFDERLCPGSELFVTAWVKSAGSESNDDAAVLFTVMGVTNKADGTQLFTPLYRYSTGQIRTTTWLTSGTPGTGRSSNEWYQVYFSFMNTSDEASSFDSYVLQVENNSASTTGGDYYIDDIRVYIAQPNAEVTQKEYTCTSERTLMNIELDWERLMSRLGTENVSGDNGISFCFIDEMTYNTTYNAYIEENGGETADQIDAAKRAAVRAALRNIGDGEKYDAKYVTLYFNNTFERNNEYGVDDKNTALENPMNNNGKYYFYRAGSEDDPDGQRLTVDFYSVLSPNRPYNMIILPAGILTDGTSEDAAIIEFADQIGNPCAIETRFYLASKTLVKINGEVIDPTTDFCIGQIFNFSLQMRYPTGNFDGEGNEIYQVIDNGVYFDWFFGSETEYTNEENEYGVSLSKALNDFRAVNPYATELHQVSVGSVSPDGAVTFDQNEHDIIEHYLNADGPAQGINKMLVLHRENLDIAILESGLELVIQPIRTLVAPEDSGLDNDQWASICWTYVPLALTVTNHAPQLYAGFNIVDYPSEDFAPALRIGLDQIQKATTEQNSLRIDLRDAEIVTAGADHLGPIDSQEDMRHIYLVATNDPQYDEWFDSESAADFDRTSLPIGDIVELYAEKYDGSGSNDHMNITFNLDRQLNGFQFNPREGYTYTFATYFEEKNSETGESYTTCYGSFNIEMKVVPENLVWQGMETDNWNNDDNWKRADASDLKITDGSYTTNEANTTSKGFVPMLFSNVIMPTGSKAELYMAGYPQGGGAWTSNERPPYMGDPTENIQYDLMVYEDENNSLTTQRFRVNICNDIHFMQGAQMLHAEQLIYTKAWMDVAVPTKKWTLVSTPLRDVYAGDWYTTTSGTQAEETYFTDITFDNSKNNRLDPAVYQRSWDKNATIVENQTNSTNVGFNTSTPMWSAAYNDASVPYTAGAGFSIKAANASDGTADSLVFRFPKADTDYDEVSTGTIDRTNEGRLFISGLLDRSDPLALVRNDDVSLTLDASQDGKYMIVGNPYMAPLDLQTFLTENSGLLTGAYWTETEKGPGVGGTDGNNWLTPDASSVIPPYGAFFVERKADATGDNTIKFTADMQKFVSDAGSGTETTAFTITADNETGRSGAVLAYTDNAVNRYEATEDVQLMRNLLGNNANELSVYTVAGDKAASVNRVKDAQQIPLGVFAADDDVTTLTFTGVVALMEPSLYDAEMNTDTPLTEGYTLTVNGASHGRYFIRAKGAGEGTTGITDVETGDGGVSVYSVAPRQVVVSSGAELLEVSVYSVGGAMLGHESVGGGRTAVTLDGIDSGVAVVRVVTADGQTTRKLVVK